MLSSSGAADSQARDEVYDKRAPQPHRDHADKEERVLQCSSAFCVSMCTFVPVKQVRPGAGVAGEQVLQANAAS
jgi:hypothetical protein